MQQDLATSTKTTQVYQNILLVTPPMPLWLLLNNEDDCNSNFKSRILYKDIILNPFPQLQQ